MPKDSASAKKRFKSTDELELQDEIGEGSSGIVFKAAIKETGEELAVKRIHYDKKRYGLIKKEMVFLQTMDHKNLVKYYNCVATTKTIDIFMELCEGGSVADLIHILHEGLGESEIRILLKEALSGLSYLHSIGKIHRDIKCGNLLLKIDGTVKIADFGLLSDVAIKYKSVTGTPYWMAPEVISGSVYNEKADIWSVGITAIEMAELRPPLATVHPLSAIFIIPSRPSPKLSKPYEFSDAFSRFLAMCLDKSPEKRKSASELLDDPFVAGAEHANSLVEKIAKANAIVAKLGRREALGEFYQTNQTAFDGEIACGGATKSESDPEHAVITDTEKCDAFECEKSMIREEPKVKTRSTRKSCPPPKKETAGTKKSEHSESTAPQKGVQGACKAAAATKLQSSSVSRKRRTEAAMSKQRRRSRHSSDSFDEKVAQLECLLEQERQKNSEKDEQIALLVKQLNERAVIVPPKAQTEQGRDSPRLLSQQIATLQQCAQAMTSLVNTVLARQECDAATATAATSSFSCSTSSLSLNSLSNGTADASTVAAQLSAANTELARKETELKEMQGRIKDLEAERELLLQRVSRLEAVRVDAAQIQSLAERIRQATIPTADELSQ